jgi:hypothetical protein
MLTVEYRQPFDFIAKINHEYTQKMAVSREKNGHCLIWLPSRDSRRNFFAYNFGFLLCPVKKNHPRTEYMFRRTGAAA